MSNDKGDHLWHLHSACFALASAARATTVAVAGFAKRIPAQGEGSKEFAPSLATSVFMSERSPLEIRMLGSQHNDLRACNVLPKTYPTPGPCGASRNDRDTNTKTRRSCGGEEGCEYE